MFSPCGIRGQIRWLHLSCENSPQIVVHLFPQGLVRVRLRTGIRAADVNLVVAGDAAENPVCENPVRDIEIPRISPLAFRFERVQCDHGFRWFQYGWATVGVDQVEPAAIDHRRSATGPGAVDV